jgi:hypothetical protein
VQSTIARQDAGGCQIQGLTFEIRHPASSLANDDTEGSYIQNADVRLQDQIDLASGQEVVVIKVTITSSAVNPADQLSQLRTSLTRSG